MLETRQLIISDLLDRGDITEADLSEAYRYSATRQITTMKALVEMGAATHRAIALARARVSEHPFVDVARFAINRENASLIPRRLAERAGVFPLFVVDGVLTVAMLDPLDLQALELIRQATHHEIDAVVCEEPVLFELIRTAYAAERKGALPRIADTQLQSPGDPPGSQPHPGDTAEAASAPGTANAKDQNTDPRAALPRPPAGVTFNKKSPGRAGIAGSPAAGDSPGSVQGPKGPAATTSPASARSKPLDADSFCTVLLESGVTAIHFASDPGGVSCRVRRKGKLAPLPQIIAGEPDLESLISEFRGECFRDQHKMTPPRSVSVFADTVGETVVVRVGSALEESDPTNPGSIGITDTQWDAITEAMEDREGLVLITGTPGSGRSTTLNTLLGASIVAERSCLLIDTARGQITSPSGPAPTRHIRRIRTKPDTLYPTIHAAARHDADVIAIDEITDALSVRAAANAALSGRLVVATFIAASPADAVERLEAFGITRATIDATLRLVVFQQPTRHESGCPGRAVFETLDPRLGVEPHSNAPTRRLSA